MPSFLMYTVITPILLSERLNKLIIKASIYVHVRAIPSVRAILSFYFPLNIVLSCCHLVSKLCPNPVDCSLPGSSVHAISQATILE